MSESQPYQPPVAGRPSVCRECRALIGAGETECSACGAPNDAETNRSASRRPAYDRETLRFARAVLTRPAPFTIIFLVACLFLFLLAALSAGNTGDTPIFNAALIAYGGKVNALINYGEWWRFVTPIFLHGNILHLLMNMYGLWMLGQYVERLYGSAKFVFFWVATGIAGEVASYLTIRPGMQLNLFSRFLFKNADVVSVGASGALFGLVGVLFVFGIKFRHELPEGFKRAFGTGMLPTILLNIFIGFTIPVIDNAAHMGGLLAGAGLALVIGYKRPGERASVAVFWHVVQIAALVLVVVCFTMIALRFEGPPPQLRNLSTDTLLKDAQADVSAYLKAMNDGQTAIEKVLYAQDESGIDGAAKALDAAPSLDEKANALRDELKLLVARARELPKGQLDRRAKARAVAQRDQLGKDFDAWLERRDQWVKTEGEKIGIKLSDRKDSSNQPDEKEGKQNQQDRK